MVLPDIAFIALAFLCCVTGVVCILLERRSRRQQRQFVELNQELDAVLQRLSSLEAKKDDKDFTAALDQAQIKARMEREAGSWKAPEKYRYVASLANHGMSPDEIADVLKISIREAEQLVKLSRVAKSET
jgi:DNA-directed RNA polymerase specialized sigma24 family protein